MNKEEIENNRIPKEIAKVLGIKKEDEDSLITFKQNLYEKTAMENVRLKKELEQKETILDKVTDKLKEDIENAEKGKDTNIILIKEYYQNKQDYAKEMLNIIEGEKK